MNWTKTANILSNVIYFIGVLIVLCLGGTCLFGSNEAVNPDSMLLMTWRENAFIWLAFGSIPMLLACIAVYKFNAIKNCVHKKLNFALIFLPGFICSACAVFVIGVICAGMVNSMFNFW